MEPRKVSDTPSLSASRSTAASADVDRIIGQEIALRRKSAGITRNNFAALLGVPQRKMKDVEAGKSRLDPSALLRAAQILAIRPSDIFRSVASAFTADLVALDTVTPPRRDTADYAALRSQLERIMEKCDDILRIIDLIDAEDAS